MLSLFEAYYDNVNRMDHQDNNTNVFERGVDKILSGLKTFLARQSSQENAGTPKCHDGFVLLVEDGVTKINGLLIFDTHFKDRLPCAFPSNSTKIQFLLKSTNINLYTCAKDKHPRVIVTTKDYELTPTKEEFFLGCKLCNQIRTKSNIRLRDHV